ncbi:hypothetical protein [Nannocystis sp. SCPEA4]|uniref:hypothetical protein n=1 Tax=Nannocystis sp. SCPEA4 TaxID=2996787 RepID=UPI00226D578C|nr:hypothetical protein [Nannocystis sp. SCPEA4]MCY1059449.1 hypothetical protein [Nannocystis sp. SCPEA4]
MHEMVVVGSLALSLAAAPSPSTGTGERQEIVQARPRILSLEAQQAERGHHVLTVRFRRPDSGVSGELQLDLWSDVESPVAEASFSVGDISHVHVRHIGGTDERDQVWLSPIIQNELARGTPDLTFVFWALLADPLLYRELSGWLSTQPLDPSLKNPLCGATKWGLKAIAYAANIACCVGGVPACVVCTLGLDDVKDAIKGIDCSKECKPDCPIG